MMHSNMRTLALATTAACRSAHRAPLCHAHAPAQVAHLSTSPPPPSTPSAAAGAADRLSFDSAAAYCRDLVFKHDHDHYLASLFLPANKRAVSWGLRAFNIELANIRESVRDDTLGRMRFQFWRDTIDSIHRGQTPNHPVAVMLAAGVHEFGLGAHRLKRVVNGRQDNFLTRQYPSIDAIEEYAESTASTLMYLHLELQGVKSLEIDHIASHLGKAATMATLLRGTPFHLRSRLFYLPADVCASNGVVVEKVIRDGPSDELSSAVFELATRANDHIITARTHVEKDGTSVKGPAMAALLPVVPTSRWLRRLEKADFDLFQGAVHQRDAWLPVYLWWANRTGKF